MTDNDCEALLLLVCSVITIAVLTCTMLGVWASVGNLNQHGIAQVTRATLAMYH